MKWFKYVNSLNFFKYDEIYFSCSDRVRGPAVTGSGLWLAGGGGRPVPVSPINCKGLNHFFGEVICVGPGARPG